MYICFTSSFWTSNTEGHHFLSVFYFILLYSILFYTSQLEANPFTSNQYMQIQKTWNISGNQRKYYTLLTPQCLGPQNPVEENPGGSLNCHQFSSIKKSYLSQKTTCYVPLWSSLLPFFQVNMTHHFHLWKLCPAPCPFEAKKRWVVLLINLLVQSIVELALLKAWLSSFDSLA